MAIDFDGQNRTLTETDVQAIASATAAAVVNNPGLIEPIANIVDGALDEKLKPVNARLETLEQGIGTMQRGLRAAGDGLRIAGGVQGV